MGPIVEYDTRPTRPSRAIRSTGSQPVIFSQLGKLCYVLPGIAISILILCVSTAALSAPSFPAGGTDAISTRLKNIQSRLPEFKHQLADLKPVE